MTQLINLLDQEGFLPAQQGQVIEQISHSKGVPFVCSVLELGIVDEDDLFTLFKNHSTYSAWDHFSQFERQAQKQAQDIANEHRALMEEFEVYPLALDKGVLFLACTDPSDRSIIQRLEFFLNYRVKPILAKKSQIQTALKGLQSDYQPRPRKFPITDLIPFISDNRKIKQLHQQGYSVPDLDEKVKIARARLDEKHAKELEQSSSEPQTPTSSFTPSELDFIDPTEDGHLSELVKEIGVDVPQEIQAQTDEQRITGAQSNATKATRQRQAPTISWSPDPKVASVQRARLATSVSAQNNKSVQEAVKGFALAGILQGIVALRTSGATGYLALAHWRRADDKSMFYTDDEIQHYISEEVNSFLDSLVFEGQKTYNLDEVDPPEELRRFSVWANSDQALSIFRQTSKDEYRVEVIILGITDDTLNSNNDLQNEIAELLVALAKSYGVDTKKSY